jgi:surface antigen
MGQRFAALCVVMALASGGFGHVAMAQGISPFSKQGGLNFTSADLKLLNSTRDQLLAAKDGDPTRRWQNPKNGATGVTTLLKTFTKDGLPCREIRYDIDVRGQKRRYVVPYCQVRDGSWKIAF